MEEKKAMIAELKKILNDKIFWIILLCSSCYRSFMAVLDFKYRKDTYWEITDNFWHNAGSVTIGVLILLVVIRIIVYDRETKVFEVINTTYKGRAEVFLKRIIASIVGVLFSVIILFTFNVLISSVIAGEFMHTDVFLKTTCTVLLGSIGYLLFCLFVCDILKNHPATIVVCGFPFGYTFMLGIKPLEAFNILWFIKHGFFTDLVRGHSIGSYLWFWITWYSLLFVLLISISLYLRKVHKEL